MKKLAIKALGKFINSTAILFPKWNAKFTFNLLSKVQRVGISENGKAFLETATQQYLEVGNESAVLHKWGTGPESILLLHGWMSNSQRWKPYVDLLDLDRFTVYALDAPGHGYAKGNRLHIEMYRKAVAAALQEIGAVNTLVCHSLGSLAVSYLFLENPSVSIRKYVIMGAPSGMDAIFDYLIKMLGLSKRAMANLDTKVVTVLKVPHQEITLANFFRNVDNPVLVVHDRTDAVTPFKPIEEALSNNQEIETFITEGLQHDLKSEAVYERVISFVQDAKSFVLHSHSA